MSEKSLADRDKEAAENFPGKSRVKLGENSLKTYVVWGQIRAQTDRNGIVRTKPILVLYDEVADETFDCPSDMAIPVKEPVLV